MRSPERTRATSCRPDRALLPAPRRLRSGSLGTKSARVSLLRACGLRTYGHTREYQCEHRFADAEPRPCSRGETRARRTKNGCECAPEDERYLMESELILRRRALASSSRNLGISSLSSVAKSAAKSRRCACKLSSFPGGFHRSLGSRANRRTDISYLLRSIFRNPIFGSRTLRLPNEDPVFNRAFRPEPRSTGCTEMSPFPPPRTFTGRGYHPEAITPERKRSHLGRVTTRQRSKSNAESSEQQV